MRVFAYAMLGVFAFTMNVSAQGAAPPENLDSVLRGWEKAMTDLKSFAAVVERDTLDKALQARDQYKGYAMFLKATAAKNDSSRARLELAKINNPKVFEKYICTGTYLYEYAPTNQVVRVHNMPQNKAGEMQQESFLSFLFGMGSEQAKARYHMEHVAPNPPDKNYHYIRIRPKLDQDKSDFSEARLSLYRANYLPAQIWYHQPNGNEITWNFSKLQIDVSIPLEYFNPDMPKDWRMERVQPKGLPAAQPVIRK
jgi:TIGR03009 family protein